MINIQNTDAITAIRDGAKLSISEGFPQQLIRSVQPVMDMTPRFHRVANICRQVEASNATAATIYTTPTDVDFYLTSACLSVIKDASSPSTYSAINITIDGITRTLLIISGFASTAQSGTVANAFTVPIKLDRGTNIAIANTSATAAIRTWATIQGYTVSTN